MSPQSAIARTEWSRRLAQTLVAAELVEESTVAPLCEEAAASGVSLGALLVSRGVLPSSLVVTTLSQLARIPAADLDADPPDPEAMNALSPAVCASYGALGYRFVGDKLAVVFSDPPEAEDLSSLSSFAGREVIPVLCDPLVIEHTLLAVRDTMADGATNGAAVQGQGNGHAATAPAAQPAAAAAAGSDAEALHIDDLLRYAVSVGASDLHLTVQMPACIRLHGGIRPIAGCPKLSNEMIREMVFGILPQSQRERFEDEHELDTSHSIANVGRFRVNVFRQRGTVAASLRPIPHEIPPFEDLGVPEAIRSFTELRRGLVLVTGPTGSGKSTTLASIIDIINRSKPHHIVTVEDPIEFLHNHKRSIVNQREIGQDSDSFAEALRRVLRQDPDVILVGELRDLETISTALTAAETGHLVFATLHTQDAPQTIDRIIDVFPTNQQDQIRVQLAACLEGVVTQQLIVNMDGTGRVPACEVMMCTAAIRNLVRSAKTHQIYSLMQTGSQYGMQTMDQSLARLVHEHRISEAVAYERCRNADDLRNHLKS